MTTRCNYVNSGYHFWPKNSDLFYELLKNVEPGLMIDVGAGIGLKTQLILKHSPRSKVVAFEPFPNNCSLFKNNINKDGRVRLIEKAASDTYTGAVQFVIPHVVCGSEVGWEGSVGYSSVGYINDRGSTVANSLVIEVPVTTVSKEINEHIRFMKIDVQGSEGSVLRGCHSIIKDHGIDMMLVEFTGQKDVLHFLTSRNYILYDTPYFVIPHSELCGKDGWIINNVGSLSTGLKALFGWPVNRPLEIMNYCDMMRDIRKNIGYIQTDIVAVHSSFYPNFMHSVSEYLNSVSCSDMYE